MEQPQLHHTNTTSGQQRQLADILSATAAVIDSKDGSFNWQSYDSCLVGHFLRVLLSYSDKDVQRQCFILQEHLSSHHGVHGFNWSHMFFLLEAADKDSGYDMPESVRFMLNRMRLFGVNANFIQALEAMTDEDTLIACDFPSMAPEVLHTKESAAKYMRAAAKRVAEGHALHTDSFFELPDQHNMHLPAERPSKAKSGEMQTA